MGPARVYDEGKCLDELHKVEGLGLRLPQPVDDFMGEWRSFNRVATPVNKKLQEEEQEKEVDVLSDGFEGARKTFIFEGEVRWTGCRLLTRYL